ncbi:MAG: MFS transporter [Candidatus Lambdaproteobacteria bacterium]|nr:MFS transporter [Candidatus Lambdaproteobacteria bacterium]
MDLSAPKRPLDYGWVIVAVSFVTLLLVLGFRYAFGVFYAAILADTGWQRAETSAIFSVAMVVYAFTSILSGALFDWLGPRRLFPLGTAILVLGMALCGTITHLWEFYLYYGVLVGVGFTLLGFVPHMANLSRWFSQKRGAASAAVLSGIGVGSLVLSVLAERLLELLGWRRTFWVLGGLIALVVAPLTLLFQREAPAAPQGDGADHQSVAGPSLATALRTPAFWMLLGQVSMVGIVNMTMVVHQTRLVVDLGYSLGLAAGLFGLTGLMRSVGGLLWGPLSDRIGRRPCIAAVTGLGIGAMVLLLIARSAPTLPLLVAFVLCYGIGFAGQTPIYVSTVAEHFAGRHAGKIFGLLDQGFGLGSALGPYLAGWLFDRTGSYSPAIAAMMACMLVSGALLWHAGGARVAPAHGRAAP